MSGSYLLGVRREQRPCLGAERGLRFLLGAGCEIGPCLDPQREMCPCIGAGCKQSPCTPWRLMLTTPPASSDSEGSARPPPLTTTKTAGLSVGGGRYSMESRNPMQIFHTNPHSLAKDSNWHIIVRITSSSGHKSHRSLCSTGNMPPPSPSAYSNGHSHPELYVGKPTQAIFQPQISSYQPRSHSFFFFFLFILDHYKTYNHPSLVVNDLGPPSWPLMASCGKSHAKDTGKSSDMVLCLCYNIGKNCEFRHSDINNIDGKLEKITNQLKEPEKLVSKMNL